MNRSVELSDRAPLVQPTLKSEKGTFSLKTFQFEFAKRTRWNESLQLRARRFAQAARFAQRTSQFFQPENQINLAAHQTFFAHRRNPASRNGSGVNNEAKFRRFVSLQFFER